jgi:hypothetical protein
VRAVSALGLIALLAPAPVAAQQSFLLVVSGLSGEARYAESFHGWATKMLGAAEARWGLPHDNVIYLAEKTERDPGRIAGRSTRENVEAAFGDIAQRAGPNDQVFVLLIGHGTTRDGEALINLPGPDMTAADFAKLLDQLPTQRVVFVNAASASGAFLSVVSGENRTVITATRSGNEKNETIFAGFFVEAYAGDGADADKDGRVSVLEAFNFARREVARAYESDGLLLTEHALLDDDADGEGTADPDPLGGGEGRLARTIFLTGSAGAGLQAPSDPRLAALYEEKRALEEEIAVLRGRKEEMDTTAYEQELERLLVDLALKTREIRELEEAVK